MANTFFVKGLILGDTALLTAPAADGTSGQVMQTNGSGVLSFVDLPESSITGTSASAPGPAVDGDPDTGLFSPAANTLAFAAGGVEGARLIESGGLAQLNLGSTSLETDSTSPTPQVWVDMNENQGGISIQTNGFSGASQKALQIRNGFNFLFGVSDSGITIGESVSLPSYSRVASGFNVGAFFNNDPAFWIGNGKDGEHGHALALLRQTLDNTAPAAGNYQTCQAQTDDGGFRLVSAMYGGWTDGNTTVEATRKGFMEWRVADAAEPDGRTAMRIESDGSAVLTSFFGASAVAQPSLTYSRTGETTAESQIRTALANLGLVADNTTS